MDEYNSIVLTREDFGDDLWNVVGATVGTLLKARYVVVIREDEDGIVAIDYNYDERLAYGNPTPRWITEDEYISLGDNAEKDKYGE